MTPEERNDLLMALVVGAFFALVLAAILTSCAAPEQAPVEPTPGAIECLAPPDQAFGVPLKGCEVLTEEILCCQYARLIQLPGQYPMHCAFIVCRDACEGPFELITGACQSLVQPGNPGEEL